MPAVLRAPGAAVVVHHAVDEGETAPKDVVRALQSLRDEQVERTRAVVNTVVALHR